MKLKLRQRVFTFFKLKNLHAFTLKGLQLDMTHIRQRVCLDFRRQNFGHKLRCIVLLERWRVLLAFLIWRLQVPMLLCLVLIYTQMTLYVYGNSVVYRWRGEGARLPFRSAELKLTWFVDQFFRFLFVCNLMILSLVLSFVFRLFVFQPIFMLFYAVRSLLFSIDSN